MSASTARHIAQFLYGDFTPGWTQDEIIDFLIQNGMNGLYLMAVRSHGGDGGSHENPWINHDPKQGLNPKVLDQWERWFARLDQAGILIFFIFYDDGVPHVGGDAFITQIVDRFEHHKHLIWVVAEEYSEGMSASTARHIAQVIRAADDYGHPIANHQLSGLKFDFPGEMDQFAVQINASSLDAVHENALTAWKNAAGRYNVNFAEHHFLDVGRSGLTDSLYRKGIWALAMGGGYNMQLGDWEAKKGRQPPSVGMAKASRILVDFFESTAFQDMAPHDELAHGGTDYVLALPGQSYIAYAADLQGQMGIKDMQAGVYDFIWLDIPSGQTIQQSQVSIEAGDQRWAKPSQVGSELALYLVRRQSGNAPPQAFDTEETTLMGQPLEISLPYSDPDGPGPYTFTILEPPAHGTLSGQGALRIYTPEAGYTGADSFRWRLHDGLVNSNIATLSLTIEPPSPNQPPIAQDQTFRGALDSPLEIQLLYTDPDGPGPYALTILEPPAHGDLSGQNNDRVYTPHPGFTGVDRFTWKVHDGLADSNLATATLLVGQSFQDVPPEHPYYQAIESL
jgi:hypothetical protein